MQKYKFYHLGNLANYIDWQMISMLIATGQGTQVDGKNLFDRKNEWFSEDGSSKEYVEITEACIDKLLSVADEDDAKSEKIRDHLKHRPLNFTARGADMLLDVIRPLYVGGALFQTRYGKIILTFDSKWHFYRGENQLFSCSLPSLNRKLKGLDERQQELYRAVANLRITQFSKFIRGFRIVKHWLKHISDINDKALAQHYGFDTHLLDLTNDFRVALFFATCKYNPDTDSYAPLTKNDIEAENGNRSGVIYHSPNSMIDSMDFLANSMWHHKHQPDGFREYSFDSGDLDGLAFQIGYQPFMRCHRQSGYIFPMKNDFPLQKDNRFEKLRFKQSPELSQRVFEMMDGGDKVFPNEGISEAKSTLDIIKKSTVFSESDVAYVYDHEEVDKTMFPSLKSFREELIEMDYEGGNIEIQEDEVEYPIGEEVRDNINRKYNVKDLMKQFGGKINYIRVI